MSIAGATAEQHCHSSHRLTVIYPGGQFAVNCILEQSLFLMPEIDRQIRAALPVCCDEERAD